MHISSRDFSVQNVFKINQTISGTGTANIIDEGKFDESTETRTSLKATGGSLFRFEQDPANHEAHGDIVVVSHQRATAVL